MSTVDDEWVRWPPAGAGEMMDEGGQCAARWGLNRDHRVVSWLSAVRYNCHTRT